MALRRPTLLVCVLTIVLGINYEISRPPPYTVPKAKATKGKARSHGTKAVDSGQRLKPSHAIQIHRESCPASGHATPATHLLHSNVNSSSSEDRVKYHMGEFCTAKPSQKRGREGKTEVSDYFSFKPTSLSGGRRFWSYNVLRRKAEVSNALSLAMTRKPLTLPENTASPTAETKENKSDGYVISTPFSVCDQTVTPRSSAEPSKCCAGLSLPGRQSEPEQLPHLTSFQPVWSTDVSKLEPARSESADSEVIDEAMFISKNITQRWLYPGTQLTEYCHDLLSDYSPRESLPPIKARDLGLRGNDQRNYAEVIHSNGMSVHFQALEAHSLKVSLRFHPSKGTEVNASEPTLAWHFSEPALRQKEFQPNGTDFTCNWKQNDSHLYYILLNISLYGSFHEKFSRGKDMINGNTQQNLRLLSLCFMLAGTLLRNEDIRRRLLQPLHMAMVKSNSIHGAIKTAVRNILAREGLPNLLVNYTANSKPLEDILQKTPENETPSLASKDRRFGHLHHWLDIPDEPNVSKIKPADVYDRDKSKTKAGFDLEKDTHRHPKWNSLLSQFYASFIPRRPLEYTVFPASFLSAVGGPVKDTMSHVLNRLASLNSLPASCDISRVRLADAGFYYDISKTERDTSNVHEVVCYSCGFAYGRWKKGDNPTTIHSNLKPDCEHLKSKNGSSTTAFGQTATVTAPSHTPYRSMSSSASSGAYMSSEASSFSGSTPVSTFSSGNAGIATEYLQQTSVPQSSLSSADSGIGTGSFSSGAASSESSQQQTPSVNHGATSRIGGGDLATDCAAVIPQPVARPTTQSGLSELARDNATSFQSGYRSSYSTSRDTSRARAQDLDDRPPLDMSCAVYPQFCRHQERRATFRDWPLADLFQPDDLVMQGFYYAGYADCLRCFYCGVGLKSWAEDDDVMTEHIRWRPSCGYVLNTKGKQFVDRVLQSIGQTNSSREQNNRESNNRAPQQNSTQPSTSVNSAAANVAQSTATRNTTSAAPVTTQATSTGAPTTAISPSASANTSQTAAAAAAATSSSPAGGNTSKEVLRKVEDMGFTKDAIARAVRHFQQAGKTKIGADALVEKILELASNIETDGNPTRSSDELQTDGPDGASNYGLGADRQRAQRILSENERLRSRQTCKLCKEARVGMIFLPCGHIVACSPCGSKTRNCTHCGEFIRATANVYLS